MEEIPSERVGIALKIGGGQDIPGRKLVLNKYSATGSITGLHKRQRTSGTWIDKISQELREL